MRYLIYFIWEDGFEDCINVNNAKERDAKIKEMIASDDFQEIGYCKIYADDEYGVFKKAYKKMA